MLIEYVIKVIIVKWGGIISHLDVVIFQIHESLGDFGGFPPSSSPLECGPQSEMRLI